MIPSAKAMGKARERIRELTDRKRNFVPIPQLIGEVNRFLTGWGGYFRHGYPRRQFDKLNGSSEPLRGRMVGVLTSRLRSSRYCMLGA